MIQYKKINKNDFYIEIFKARLIRMHMDVQLQMHLMGSNELNNNLLDCTDVTPHRCGNKTVTLTPVGAV